MLGEGVEVAILMEQVMAVCDTVSSDHEIGRFSDRHAEAA